ncbi:MAG TPA: hypothetical protein VFB33_11775 [Candidatus Binataceae bacterium]|jgi:alcohol dehydrogenase class IV|nr:hypothetical protein [Candidatus Binataceae bacterium]
MPRSCHGTPPARVGFGAGNLKSRPAESERLGARRALVESYAVLRESGIKEEWLDRAAAPGVQNACYNPRPVTRDGVRALLDDAFAGRPPRS